MSVHGLDVGASSATRTVLAAPGLRGRSGNLELGIREAPGARPGQGPGYGESMSSVRCVSMRIPGTHFMDLLAERERSHGVMKGSWELCGGRGPGTSPDPQGQSWLSRALTVERSPTTALPDLTSIGHSTAKCRRLGTEKSSLHFPAQTVERNPTTRPLGCISTGQHIVRCPR